MRRGVRWHGGFSNKRPSPPAATTGLALGIYASLVQAKIVWYSDTDTPLSAPGLGEQPRAGRLAFYTFSPSPSGSHVSRSLVLISNPLALKKAIRPSRVGMSTRWLLLLAIRLTVPGARPAPAAMSR